MKTIKTILLSLAAAALLAVGAAQAATPKNTFVMAKDIADIITMDPAEVFELTTGEIIANIYDRVMMFEPEDLQNLVGGVTESAATPNFREVVADKGYFKVAMLAWLEDRDIRSYISQPRSRNKRRWTDKPEGHERAYRNNRRRSAGTRSSELHRLRSERVERSFAHTCRTGRARRTWLRGVADVTKRYLLQAAGRNLGTIMRSLFGFGTPRALQAAGAAAVELLSDLVNAITAFWRHFATKVPGRTEFAIATRSVKSLSPSSADLLVHSAA